MFVDWLNAIIYEMATQHMLFGRFQVQVDGPKLCGKAWGQAYDSRKHQVVVEAKGATYTQLKVGRDESGRWIAQCVVDV